MCTSGTRTHRVRGQRYSGLEACKIERDIENFVENFKKKESYLDNPQVIQRPPSLESCSSSQSRSSRPSSSMYSSDLTDESPEKTTYLLPEIVRRYRYCSTTTTSDSEGGEEDFRRLLLAYKDSKRHSNANNPTDTVGTTGTGGTATSSVTEGPDYIPGKVSFFSSTGRRPASLCQSLLSVVRPSVSALTFSLNIFFSETTYRILMKFHRNVPTMVLFRIS